MDVAVPPLWCWFCNTSTNLAKRYEILYVQNKEKSFIPRNGCGIVFVHAWFHVNFIPDFGCRAAADKIDPNRFISTENGLGQF